MTASPASRETRLYRDGADLAAHIREQAATVVRDVNPGREHSGSAFDATVTKVAEAMAAKLVKANAPRIASAIRTAWEENR